MRMPLFLLYLLFSFWGTVAVLVFSGRHVSHALEEFGEE
jgi:hypothetical protein